MQLWTQPVPWWLSPSVWVLTVSATLALVGHFGFDLRDWSVDDEHCRSLVGVQPAITATVQRSVVDVGSLSQSRILRLL